MIYGVHGRPRSGKTLLITCCLFWHYIFGRKIKSNFKLNFPDKDELKDNGISKLIWKYYHIDVDDINLKEPEPLDLNYIIENYPNSANELSNTTLGLDELQSWMDSRRSMDDSNVILSYILFQSGKHDVDVFYTSQLLGAIDLRVEKVSNNDIFCARIPDNERSPLDGVYMMIRDNFTGEITEEKVWDDFYYYFDMYDTKEPVWRTVTGKDKDKKLKKASEIQSLLQSIKRELAE